jgi:hypothetical protein
LFRTDYSQKVRRKIGACGVNLVNNNKNINKTTTVFPVFLVLHRKIRISSILNKLKREFFGEYIFVLRFDFSKF